MKKNMGTIDRLVRSLIAIVAIYLFISGAVPATLGLIVVAGAVIFLFTSLVSFCPLYTLFGIKTCPAPKN